MMLRVTTLELFKLDCWNATRGMNSVLLEIKAFLAKWARLDLNSERNDLNKYPEGAYLDIENDLLR